MDILTRYEHGEFFSQDSIKQDQSQIFETSLGRPVYGGGGIMPDIFVPQDTTGMTSYYRMAVNRGLTSSLLSSIRTTTVPKCKNMKQRKACCNI